MNHRDTVQLAEELYRLAEFREHLQSNVLFPVVPDNIVRPLVEQLRAAEHVLVAALYDLGEYERVAAIQRAMQKPETVPS